MANKNKCTLCKHLKRMVVKNPLKIMFKCKIKNTLIADPKVSCDCNLFTNKK